MTRWKPRAAPSGAASLKILVRAATSAGLSGRRQARATFVVRNVWIWAAAGVAVPSSTVMRPWARSATLSAAVS
jgi:hypothetical protein